MKLDEVIKQQKKRNLKIEGFKAKMQSYEDYVNDSLSPRPYNTANVIGIKIPAKLIVVEDTRTTIADEPR